MNLRLYPWIVLITGLPLRSGTTKSRPPKHSASTRFWRQLQFMESISLGVTDIEGKKHLVLLGAPPEAQPRQAGICLLTKPISREFTPLHNNPFSRADIRWLDVQPITGEVVLADPLPSKRQLTKIMNAARAVLYDGRPNGPPNEPLPAPAA